VCNFGLHVLASGSVGWAARGESRAGLQMICVTPLVDLRKKYPLVSCEALQFREYALQSGSTLKSVASKVGYCDTTESACTVANMISQRLVRDGSGNAVMGLDCEWTPANKRGRSHAYYDSIDMIQIACELTCHVRGHEHEVEHIVVCFHVAHSTRREIPTQLRTLLEDKRILKVGRGIKGDCTRLRRDNRTAITPPDELYDGRSKSGCPSGRANKCWP
jgi:hypothetical protein